MKDGGPVAPFGCRGDGDSGQRRVETVGQLNQDTRAIAGRRGGLLELQQRQ